jgi:peptidoglycan hydrolase CwlO-like protein
MKSGYGSSKLLQVLRTFPELNRDWLVYGEGEMINIQKELSSFPSECVEMSESAIIPSGDTLVAELRSQIEKLQAKVDNLNQEIGEKNALIKFLRNEVVESV